MSDAAEPRFLADCMLGKVARWLAILGYDSAYARPEEGDDRALQERARREGRVLLTRDTRIPEVRGLRMIVLREQRFEEQLRRVVREAGLAPDPARLFSRCTECNRALEPVAREAVLAELPPKVRELPTEFKRCPGCARLYWRGSHTDRTVAALRKERILPAQYE